MELKEFGYASIIQSFEGFLYFGGFFTFNSNLPLKRVTVRLERWFGC